MTYKQQLQGLLICGVYWEKNKIQRHAAQPTTKVDVRTRIISVPDHAHQT